MPTLRSVIPLFYCYQMHDILSALTRSLLTFLNISLSRRLFGQIRSRQLAMAVAIVKWHLPLIIARFSERDACSRSLIQLPLIFCFFSAFALIDDNILILLPAVRGDENKMKANFLYACSALICS